MDYIEQLNPTVIFTALAIIFAILNFALWTMVWNILKTRRKYSGTINFKKISNSLKTADQKNEKIEDQLWGVLDKLKELEKQIDRLEKSGNVQIENKDMKTVKAGTKKIFSLVKREHLQLKKLNKSLTELTNMKKDMKNLKNKLQSLSVDQEDIEDL